MHGKSLPPTLNSTAPDWLIDEFKREFIPSVQLDLVTGDSLKERNIQSIQLNNFLEKIEVKYKVQNAYRNSVRIL